MPDLREHFRAADQIPVADLVDAVHERLIEIAREDVPRPISSRATPRSGRDIARRVATIAAAFLIAAATIAFVVRAFGRGTTPGGQPLPFEQIHGWIVRGGNHLVAVDPEDPTQQIPLTEQDRFVEAPLAWASDGSRLLFTRALPSAGDTSVDLFVLNEDGSQVRVATDARPFGGGSLSPDGTEVVYVVSKSIYVVNATGGQAHLLVAGDANDGWYPEPTWSPDGMTIAYTTYTGHPSVWLMNADGTSPRLLLDLTDALGPRWGGGLEGLKWSPDGAWLSFAQGTNANHSEIFVVRVDGTGLTQLTRSGRDTWNAYPSWSPDGSRVAFWRMHGGLNTVDAVDLEGSAVTELFGPDDALGFIAWNPVPRSDSGAGVSS